MEKAEKLIDYTVKPGDPVHTLLIEFAAGGQQEFKRRLLRQVRKYAAHEHRMSREGENHLRRRVAQERRDAIRGVISMIEHMEILGD